MKQNQWLINQMKEIERLKAELRKATSQNVPEIYACICKIMIDEYHNSVEDVTELIIRSQGLWNELVENDEVENMVDWCEKTTGVSLRGEEENERKTEESN